MIIHSSTSPNFPKYACSVSVFRKNIERKCEKDKSDNIIVGTSAKSEIKKQCQQHNSMSDIKVSIAFFHLTVRTSVWPYGWF